MLPGTKERVVGAFVALLLAIAPSPVLAQGTATVTGRVTSASGEPLAGASVFIREIQVGGTATEGGRYTFQVPAARIRGQQLTLTARFLGYKPISRVVTLTAGANTADFQLERDVSRLSEVVVTGVAGETEKKKLAFSVTTIRAEDLPVPSSNPLSQLSGKVPGANIVSATGRPGASPQIILRAPTSLDASGEGQGPLIIVDGIILNASMSDLNPLDIESVEVVKGAAASSLYGARAGKGVIQITTKSGKSASQGARFAVRTEYGQSGIERQFKKAANHPFLLNADGSKFCANAACSTTFDYNEELAKVNNSTTTVVQAPAVAPFIGGAWVTFQDKAWPGGKTFNAIDEVSKTGNFANTDFSVTGRAGKTSYFASVNRNEQGGTILGVKGYSRNSLRLNVDQGFGDDWFLSVRSQYTGAKSDGQQFDGGGPFFTLTRMPAGVSVLSRDSLGRRYVRIALDGENSNPVYDLENLRYTQTSDRFLAGTTVKYLPTDWMDVEANFSLDRALSRSVTVREKGYRTLRQSGNNNGSLEDAANGSTSINTSLQANFRKNLGTDLRTRYALRYLFERQDFNDARFNGREFAVGGIETGSNLAQTTLGVGSGRSSIRQIGFFGIANVEYKERYIVDALVRQDGSSLFGADNRWATFGRGSFAWRVSEEPWAKLPAVTDWKLRYSVGSAGTRPAFDAQYETYSVSGGQVSPVLLGNKKLGVQVSVEQEFGTDIQLLDKYSLSVSRFQTKIRDQLVRANLPAAAGFTQQWRNAGTVETQGYEVQLTLPLITKQDFSWTFTGQWDQSFSRITALNIPAYQYGPDQQGASAMFYARKGERIGTIYGTRFAKQCSDLPANLQGTCGNEFQRNDDGYLVWVGAGNTWRDGISKKLWGTLGPTLAPAAGRVGQLTWGTPFTAQDSSGATYVPLGNTLPRYRFGIANTVTWKAFSVYALVDASIGQNLYNLGLHWSYFENYSAEQDQAGKPDERKKPIGYYGTPGLYNVLQPNSAFVEDASFAKLRELSVAYRFKNLTWVGGDWTVNLLGRNLLTITDYKGFDPETGRSGGRAGSAVINGVDAFVFPNPRTWTISLSTSF